MQFSVINLIKNSIIPHTSPINFIGIGKFPDARLIGIFSQGINLLNHLADGLRRKFGKFF